MTLGHMLHQRGRALEPNDYEFVVGDDGLAHLVIFVNIRWQVGHDKPMINLFNPCGAITGNAERLEIAKTLTCLACGRR